MNYHKSGMYFVNLICCILAVCLLFTSIIVDRKIHEIDRFINDSPMKAMSLILYVLGCSYLFLIFSMGCVGTSAEHGGLLFTYSFSMLFLVIIQASLALFSMFHIDHMTDEAVAELKHHFFASTEHFNINSTLIYQHVETRLSCCGLSGPSDYSGLGLPKSCCNNTAIFYFICDVNHAHKIGCVKALVLYLHTIAEFTTIVCLINGVIFIIASIYIGFFAEKLKLTDEVIERPIY